MLLEQRRMVGDICDLVSQAFCNGQLRTAAHLDPYVTNLRSTLRAYKSRAENFLKPSMCYLLTIRIAKIPGTVEGGLL